MTAIFMLGVLACVALAINIGLLAIASDQQYNNAAYAAEAAIRAFKPALCLPSQDEQSCLYARFYTKQAKCSVPFDTFPSSSAFFDPFGLITQEDAEAARHCLERSARLAAKAVDSMSSYNRYVTKSGGASNKTTIETTPGAFPLEQTGPANLPSGQLLVGHCRLKQHYGNNPPNFCRDEPVSYCCYTLNFTGPSGPFLDSTNGATPSFSGGTYNVANSTASDTIAAAANNEFTLQNVINGVRVQLSTESQAGGAVSTVFRLFGVSSVQLRRGNATAVFIPERMNFSRNEASPYATVSAAWAPWSTTVSDWTNPLTTYLRPTPTPAPPPPAG